MELPFCREQILGTDTDTDKAILKEFLPPGYMIHHQPRLGEKAGGGVDLLCKENIIRSHSDVYSSSFEHFGM